MRNDSRRFLLRHHAIGVRWMPKLYAELTFYDDLWGVN